MNKLSKESKDGCIISCDVESFENQPNKNLQKYIACQIKDGEVIKGEIKIAGKINNNLFVYGIKLENHFPFCIEHKLKEIYNWDYNYLVLVEQSIDLIEIYKENEFVKSSIENDSPGKYDNNEVVLVKYISKYKAANILRSGTVDGISCCEIKFMEKIDNRYTYTVIENDIKKMLDERGCIIDQDGLDLQYNEDNITVKVDGKFKNENWEGVLKWKGKVNGYPCIGLYNVKYKMNDFSNYVKKTESYFVLIPISNNKSFNNKDIEEGKYSDRSLQNGATKFRVNYANNDKPKYLDFGYVPALPKMTKSDNIKIRYDKDIVSTYMLINSMFLVSEIFENFLLEGGPNTNKPYINEVLKVVFSIRKEENTEDWEALAQLINKINEGEDIFEKLLSMMDFNFRMWKLDKDEIYKIPFICLSSDIIKNKYNTIKLIEILSSHCVHKEQLILYPPKSFLIRLPKDIKILIPLKLDITKLTLTSVNCCSVCSSEALYLCSNCSKEQMDLIYFCRDHKIHCKHDKKEVTKKRKDWKEFNFKIELDLVSVVFKKEYYNEVYMKTCDIDKDWTHLSFVNTEVIKDFSKWKEYETEFETKKSDECICIYKYAPLEYYVNDFK